MTAEKKKDLSKALFFSHLSDLIQENIQSLWEQHSLVSMHDLLGLVHTKLLAQVPSYIKAVETHDYTSSTINLFQKKIK